MWPETSFLFFIWPESKKVANDNNSGFIIRRKKKQLTPLTPFRSDEQIIFTTILSSLSEGKKEANYSKYKSYR